MARQVINLGSSPNKGDGDPLRLAFEKINANFAELYDATPAGGQFVGDLIGNVLSDDSTVILNNQTAEFNGNVNGDIYGSVLADDSSVLVDSETGDHYGTFNGTLTGDVIGSVFADDSTVLVDAVNGVIPGYVSIDQLKSIVAQSTDFNDFKTRISNL